MTVDLGVLSAGQLAGSAASSSSSDGGGGGGVVVAAGRLTLCCSQLHSAQLVRNVFGQQRSLTALHSDDTVCLVPLISIFVRQIFKTA